MEDIIFYFAITYALLMVFNAALAPHIGKTKAFLLGFALYAFVDIVTNRVGLWTIYAGLTWAIISIAYTKFSKNISPLNLAKRTISGIIVFDLLTALIFGWQFNQTLMQTLLGQIPFTISHIIAVLTIVTAYAAMVLLLRFVSKQPIKNLLGEVTQDVSTKHIKTLLE